MVYFNIWQKIEQTCMSDAIKEWNSATNSIKNTESLYQAKKEIKLYSKTLPI